ncbi:MAG: dihydrodipicolinate synthase family protein [Burkholderiaceae bacterium]
MAIEAVVERRPNEEGESSRLQAQAVTPERGNRAGLYFYVVTPYSDRGDVDTGVLGEYVSEITRSGVTGITCIASTCEGPYLTDDERNLVIDTVSRRVGGRVELNIGVGAVSTRQAIEYSKRARDAGATSLMLEFPQYFPIEFEAVYRHYEAVANAVALPIRLYNIPLPTRFDFTPDRLLRMAEIAAIQSVKDASGDVTRLRDIRMLCGDRFALLCGLHFQVLDGLRLGADGWEVMTHPVITKDLIHLYETLRADPWSADGERMYQRLQPLFYFFRQFGVPQSIKAISAWTDLKLGQPRAPLQTLSPASMSRLRQIVEQLGIL